MPGPELVQLSSLFTSVHSDALYNIEEINGSLTARYLEGKRREGLFAEFLPMAAAATTRPSCNMHVINSFSAFPYEKRESKQCHQIRCESVINGSDLTLAALFRGRGQPSLCPYMDRSGKSSRIDYIAKSTVISC